MQILPIEVVFIDKNHTAFKAIIEAVILEDRGVYIPTSAKHDGRTFDISRTNSKGTLNYIEKAIKK